MNQAASLGTPIMDILTSPAFVQVVPAGFVLPEVGGPGPGSNGANMAYISITSISLMLLATIPFF